MPNFKTTVILLVSLTYFLSGLNIHTSAQSKVLHYSETSGYDHNTRSQSLAMFQAMAIEQGFQVTDDQTGDEFESLTNLNQYDVIVFSNTSGDAILDASQRQNFESYIANGGSYLGIHAASDTYRHSSANGNNTGIWDFYAELVGASVQENPNHVNGTPLYSMAHVSTHPTLQNLPDPWPKNEEYYYWENGFYGSANVPILEVEETIGPNNLVNSYDAARPIAWFRQLAAGGRMFYTALGHATGNYQSDEQFIVHISNAIAWLLDTTTQIETAEPSKEKCFIRQTDQSIQVFFATQPRHFSLSIYNSLGQEVWVSESRTELKISEIESGWKLMVVRFDDQTSSHPLFIP